MNYGCVYSGREGGAHLFYWLFYCSIEIHFGQIDLILEVLLVSFLMHIFYNIIFNRNLTIFLLLSYSYNGRIFTS